MTIFFPSSQGHNLKRDNRTYGGRDEIDKVVYLAGPSFILTDSSIYPSIHPSIYQSISSVRVASRIAVGESSASPLSWIFLQVDPLAACDGAMLMQYSRLPFYARFRVQPKHQGLVRRILTLRTPSGFLAEAVREGFL
jgi:hypothetical protein